MDNIYADVSISVTELMERPAAIIEQAEGLPVAILNHNKPVAYLVPAATFELLMDALDDAELAELVRQRGAERKMTLLEE
ncbi:MAG: type II toxin-antitoxin system prevent-host-death family antitoxin [Rhodocyclaceae bacterium]|nr:type II toxin-antitoxin system prevent-host-death family antitoxin [Rhodocyclaceae bacterium]